MLVIEKLFHAQKELSSQVKMIFCRINFQLENFSTDNFVVIKVVKTAW